ncbi:hypothetical protein V1514DRAFT_326920 [Lipomyces japonicus]|uniref:uncharacterized protein n=1 Tax=Lipomyces japonicus TaxID=56871 RepID=UPI0034CF6B63
MTTLATPPLQDSILQHIGKTPLVRLNRIPQAHGIKATILAKLEYFNAGGSVKDRIALRMIEDAEKSGRIKPGYTLIEPTSGNTGIGLALVGAVKGYKVIITMPEKMSQEKVLVLKALGAEIIRTPTEAAWDSPQSYISVARRLEREIPNSAILNQYENVNNPLAHELGTGQEIWEQTAGQVTAVVVGAGTGGTVTGIARALKKHNANVKIIGVDPIGSILALPESLNPPLQSYKIEGIGYDFVPEVLDRSLVDRWIKTDDAEAFHLSRRLIAEEGILCGGSSGSALASVLKYARDLDANETVVVVFPDSIRSYLTKFVSDEWMRDNGFQQDSTVVDNGKKFKDATIADLSLKPVIAIGAGESVQKAIQVMKNNGYDQLPVVDDDNGLLVGIVTLGEIFSRMGSRRVRTTSVVRDATHFFVPDQQQHQQHQPTSDARTSGDDHFGVFTADTPLSSMTTFFEFHSAAVVTTTGEVQARPTHIVTKVDLLEYLVRNGGLDAVE